MEGIVTGVLLLCATVGWIIVQVLNPHIYPVHGEDTES